MYNSPAHSLREITARYWGVYPIVPCRAPLTVKRRVGSFGLPTTRPQHTGGQDPSLAAWWCKMVQRLVRQFASSNRGWSRLGSNDNRLVWIPISARATEFNTLGGEHRLGRPGRVRARAKNG